MEVTIGYGIDSVNQYKLPELSLLSGSEPSEYVTIFLGGSRLAACSTSCYLQYHVSTRVLRWAVF